jgi:hypothetical protein
MRLIVQLYDKVPDEYHAYGVSTSSRSMWIGAGFQNRRASQKIQMFICWILLDRIFPFLVAITVAKGEDN